MKARNASWRSLPPRVTLLVTHKMRLTHKKPSTFLKFRLILAHRSLVNSTTDTRPSPCSSPPLVVVETGRCDCSQNPGLKNPGGLFNGGRAEAVVARPLPSALSRTTPPWTGTTDEQEGSNWSSSFCRRNPIVVLSMQASGTTKKTLGRGACEVRSSSERQIRSVWGIRCLLFVKPSVHQRLPRVCSKSKLLKMKHRLRVG